MSPGAGGPRMVRTPGRSPARTRFPVGAAGIVACLGAVGPFAFAAAPVAAQDEVEALAAACAGGAPTLAGPCLETVLAVQAAQGLIGLGASGGASLPGSSSTLGKRFDGMPRLGFSVRGGFTNASVPDALGPATGPAPENGALAPSVQATVAAGVFQGFSTAPTMGGILSLDLLGTFSYVSLPGDRSYRDSPKGLGLGARIGVFRESFTLPGITVSATRRWMGDVRLGPRGDVGGTRAELDVTVTSLRGTVGKTLANVDALVGIGWDRYGSEVDLLVRPAAGGGPEGRAGADSFTSERILLYGGVGYTFLVYQLSAEAGFARGFDDVAGRARGGYDPTAGTAFLRLGLRLTY